MKKYPYLIAGLFLLSCQQKSPGGEVRTITEEPDSIISPDCTIQLVTKIDSEVPPNEPDVMNTLLSKTDSFLLNPFDLYAFKSNKKLSLSGSTNFRNYHYIPEQEGIGYRFFMFEPKKVNYIQNGREMRDQTIGYMGANKERISKKEDGLVILTFQPNDKFIHKFLNPNEILIELTARHNDFDLPEMAFVGLDSLSIIKQFGKESFYKNHSLIYTFENITFILKLKNAKVDWIRYIRLVGKFENYANDKRLYQLDGNQ